MSNIVPFERRASTSGYRAADPIVGLLDSLLDAMVTARPGRDAAWLAAEIRRLGDSAAYFAERLDTLSAPPAMAPTPKTLAQRKRRHALGA